MSKPANTTPIAKWDIRNGNCIEVMREMPDNSVDAIVTDPPYGLSKEPNIAEVMQHWINGDAYEHKASGFMGKNWDSFVPGPEYWKEALRVLKPGGHALVFAGTRTQDLMTVALRFGGFEIRDSLRYYHDGEMYEEHYPSAWIYGSGFPKSQNVSKALDKMAGAERKVVGKRMHPTLKDTSKIDEQANAAHGGNSWRREWDIDEPSSPEAQQWDGWGSALKPAYEPIILARKPLDGTIAGNVLKHGVGGINIDGCRVSTVDKLQGSTVRNDIRGGNYSGGHIANPGDIPDYKQSNEGRFPANIIHDGSDEVLRSFPESKGQQGDVKGTEKSRTGDGNCYGKYKRVPAIPKRSDSGSAARFFYCAKTSKTDRNSGDVENTHPTVKPESLMRYLCKLITPPGGMVLDPFAGSGSTGKAAILEGFGFMGIEREPEFCEIARARCQWAEDQTGADDKPSPQINLFT